MGESAPILAEIMIRKSQEAVITRTKKAIMKEVVEPHRKALSPAKRDSILALLKRLTY